MHLNRTIRLNPQGKLIMDNQEVDFDMILCEEEAINLLEEELMEGLQTIYYPDEEEYRLTENDDRYPFVDDDTSSGEDILFKGGYFDISDDEFDVTY